MTKREKAYIYWRARGNTVIEAIQKAGYKAKTRIDASKYGSKLEAKEEIKENIEQEKVKVFDKNLITDELILFGMRDIAVNGKSEVIKLKALEALARCKGLEKQVVDFTDKTNQSKAEQDEYKSLMKAINDARQTVAIGNSN